MMKMKMKTKTKTRKKETENSRNWFNRREEPSEKRKDDWFYFNVRYSVRKRRKLKWPGLGLFSSNSGSSEPSLAMKLLLAVGWSSEKSIQQAKGDSAHAGGDSSLKASAALQVRKTSRFFKKTKMVQLELNGRYNGDSTVTIKERTTDFLRRCCSSIGQHSSRYRGSSGSLKEPPAEKEEEEDGRKDEKRLGHNDAGTFLSHRGTFWREDPLKTLPLKVTSVFGAMFTWTAIYLLRWALVALQRRAGDFAAPRLYNPY